MYMLTMDVISRWANKTKNFTLENDVETGIFPCSVNVDHHCSKLYILKHNWKKYGKEERYLAKRYIIFGKRNAK